MSPDGLLGSVVLFRGRAEEGSSFYAFRYDFITSAFPPGPNALFREARFAASQSLAYDACNSGFIR